MPTWEDLHTAVAQAIRFFDATQEPFALLWLDVMHRRFEIEPFADALRRFDEALGRQPSPLMRVFRRIADPDNPLHVEDLDAVTQSSDRILVTALYCDRLALPPSFPEVLAKAVRAGGYYLTHVLLASIWMRARGYGPALPPGFIDDLYRCNAAIIDEDPTTVTDLKLEAAAFLYLAEKGSLVTDRFVASVIVTQNHDGGWGKRRDGRDGSDWHATILGLLLLLHVRLRAERV